MISNVLNILRRWCNPLGEISGGDILTFNAIDDPFPFSLSCYEVGEEVTISYILGGVQYEVAAIAPVSFSALQHDANTDITIKAKRGTIRSITLGADLIETLIADCPGLMYIQSLNPTLLMRMDIIKCPDVQLLPPYYGTWLNVEYLACRATSSVLVNTLTQPGGVIRTSTAPNRELHTIQSDPYAATLATQAINYGWNVIYE